MDTYIDGDPQLADADDVVEVDRPGRAEAGDRALPVLARLRWPAVPVPGAEADRVGLDVGGAGELPDGGSQRP